MTTQDRTELNLKTKAAELLNILTSDIGAVIDNGQAVGVFLVNGGSMTIPRRYWL